MAGPEPVFFCPRLRFASLAASSHAPHKDFAKPQNGSIPASSSRTPPIADSRVETHKRAESKTALLCAVDTATRGHRLTCGQGPSTGHAPNVTRRQLVEGPSAPARFWGAA